MINFPAGGTLPLTCLWLSSVLWASPVWPERSSSAAGVRTADLIAAFQEWGYSVAYLRREAALSACSACITCSVPHLLMMHAWLCMQSLQGE